MTLQQLAKEMVSLNHYAKDTEDTILRVARLFEERSGECRLEEIGNKELIKFKEETLQLAKPVTLNGYLRYLRLLGEYAIEEKYLRDNPFRKLKFAQVGKPPFKTVDNIAFIKAFNTLSNNEQFKPAWFWKIVLRVLYYTGIRRRQLVSLEFSDIDFERKLLKASYRGSKTKREWDLPIHDELIPDLRYLIQKNEDALMRPMKPNDALFNVCRFYSRYTEDPNNPGRMKRESITGFMKRLSNKIEMPIGAHRIRHTLATNLCNPETGEPDIFSAQELLGHSNLATTKGYVKPKIKRMRNAMKSLKTL